MKKKITDTIDGKILIILDENYGDDADRNAECMLEIKKELKQVVMEVVGDNEEAMTYDEALQVSIDNGGHVSAMEVFGADVADKRERNELRAVQRRSIEELFS